MGKLMGLPGRPTLMAIVQEYGITQRQGVDPVSRRTACVIADLSRGLVEIHSGPVLIHAGKGRGQLLRQQCIEQRGQGRQRFELIEQGLVVELLIAGEGVALVFEHVTCDGLKVQFDFAGVHHGLAL
ncbi:hypothetical protein J3D47_003133 [Pseudomonas laurylsulfativorans]|nr:hypothetical protein [Pseudomonas laurylsulfativorans]